MSDENSLLQPSPYADVPSTSSNGATMTESKAPTPVEKEQARLREMYGENYSWAVGKDNLPTLEAIALDAAENRNAYLPSDRKTIAYDTAIILSALTKAVEPLQAELIVIYRGLRHEQDENARLREALRFLSHDRKAQCWCRIRDERGDKTKDVFHSPACVRARAALPAPKATMHLTPDNPRCAKHGTTLESVESGDRVCEKCYRENLETNGPGLAAQMVEALETDGALPVRLDLDKAPGMLPKREPIGRTDSGADVGPSQEPSPPTHFRKRPVEIEAWQWNFSTDQEEAPSWITDGLGKWPALGGLAFEPDHPDGPRICIATLEGVMTSTPGDWIIKGIQGELYTCKPDIFEATYEPVGPQEPSSLAQELEEIAQEQGLKDISAEYEHGEPLNLSTEICSNCEGELCYAGSQWMGSYWGCADHQEVNADRAAYHHKDGTPANPGCRKVCLNCKQPVTPSGHVDGLQYLHADNNTLASTPDNSNACKRVKCSFRYQRATEGYFHPKNCPECKGTGWIDPEPMEGQDNDIE